MVEKIAVFIDWQNAYARARDAFGLGGLPNQRGNFSPLALGQIVAAGRGRGADGKLVRVEVHRGLPSSKRDPVGYGANRRQAAAWVAEAPAVVTARLRALAYQRASQPVEKGVDVALALGAVEQVLTKRCDVAVLFTHDTDIAPAVELLAELVGPRHVETASWRSHRFKQRLPPVRGVHHHYLSDRVFRKVERAVNYAYRG